MFWRSNHRIHLFRVFVRRMFILPTYYIYYYSSSSYHSFNLGIICESIKAVRSYVRFSNTGSQPLLRVVGLTHKTVIWTC